MKEYTALCRLSGQYKFCGNSFTIDTYRGCSFGCKYCFANSRLIYKFEPGVANIEKISKQFDDVFLHGKKAPYQYECLAHRVPLHCGGMSDPFQPMEFEHRVSLGLIRVTKRYNYPVMFSSKTADLPDEYFNELDPKIHAFQISLMGHNDEFVRSFETGSPLPSERIKFIKKLRSKGFWVGVRIQPMVDLFEAESLIKSLNGVASYWTIEHLKVPIANMPVRILFKEQILKGDYILPPHGAHYELRTALKMKNLQHLKAVAEAPVGAGDNDIHELSESKCCCGIDTIGPAFDNWLKYNYTYFATTGNFDDKETLWTPKCTLPNCNSFNPAMQKLGMRTFKEHVDYYCEEFPNSIFRKKDTLF